MKKKPDNLLGAELRRQAEAKLIEREKKGAAYLATDADTRRLVHELEVHQIELEMQNEELAQSRAQVEAGLRQYTNLYDFAPAGYLTLARDGAIRQANLSEARLLGVERGKLVKRRFGVFVSAQSRTTFDTFLEKVFGSQQKESCEVALLKDGHESLWVHIEATSSEDRKECSAVLVDITERKRVELSLQQSEKKFRDLVESALVGVFQTTVTGDILYANETAMRIFKFDSVEEMISYGAVVRYKNPTDRKVFIENLKKTGKVLNFEFDALAKDGETITILMSAAQSDGNINGMVLDITERKRAKEALRVTNEYLENLFNYANAPVIVWDPQFRITRFNPAFESLTGRSAKEVIGKSLEILFPPELVARSMDLIRKAQKGERWRTVEISILQVDGSVRVVLWNSASVMGSDGKTPIATIAQGQDITERKLAVESLRETNEYLENLITYANAPIIVWDPQFRISRFNHAFETLTGRNAPEVLDKPLDLLFPPAQVESSMQLIKKTVGGERWETVEIEIQRKDGESRTVLWNSANILDKDGKTVVATIAQGYDITERMRAEEKILRQLDELRRWQEVTLGREDRNRQLKREVNELLILLGKTIRYPSQETDAPKDQPNVAL